MLILAIDTATPRVSVARRPRRRRARRRAASTAAAATPSSSRRRSSTCARELEVELRQLAAIAVGIGPGLFTGLRVGVTTAQVMAQALRIPMVGVPTLDLVAYPLRHTRRLVVAVVDARRDEVFFACYRTVPGGVQRITEYEVGAPDDLVGELEARGRGRHCSPATARCVTGDELEQLDRVELAGPALALAERCGPRGAGHRALRAGGVRRATRRPSAVPSPERRGDRVGPEGVMTRRSRRGPMAAERDPEPLMVHIVPMRRRHLRSVLRIETQVYPRPWTHVAVPERARVAFDAARTSSPRSAATSSATRG